MNRVYTVATLLVVAMLLLILGGYYGFKRYKVHRFDQLGEQALRDQSWIMSRFWFERALTMDPDNEKILRKIALNSVVHGDPLVLSDLERWHRQSAEPMVSAIALADYHYKTANAGALREVIAQASPDWENSPDFRRIRIQYHQLMGQMLQSLDLARKAVADFPNHEALELLLLENLLSSKIPAMRQTTEELQSKLEKNPSSRAQVMRLKVDYFQSMGQVRMAREILERWIATGNATWEDRLTHVRLLIMTEDSPVMPDIKSLGPVPPWFGERVAHVLMQSGNPKLASLWMDSLSGESFSDRISFQFQRALAHAAAGEWQLTIENLTDGDWGAFEALRSALLSRAYRMLEQNQASEDHWRDAERSMHSNISAMTQLAFLIRNWEGYEARWVAILERMIVDGIHVPWVFGELTTHYLAHKDTWKLYAMSLSAHRRARDRPQIQNQALYFSLLLGRERSRTKREVEEAALLRPGDVAAQVNLAFARMLDGNDEEAQKVLQSVDSGSSDLQYSVIQTWIESRLAAKGLKPVRRSTATFNMDDLLPEEKQLLSRIP
jgi:tetratricopeptide (TPR) repeat protein